MRTQLTRYEIYVCNTIEEAISDINRYKETADANEYLILDIQDDEILKNISYGDELYINTIDKKDKSNTVLVISKVDVDIEVPDRIDGIMIINVYIKDSKIYKYNDTILAYNQVKEILSNTRKSRELTCIFNTNISALEKIISYMNDIETGYSGFYLKVDCYDLQKNTVCIEISNIPIDDILRVFYSITSYYLIIEIGIERVFHIDMSRIDINKLGDMLKSNANNPYNLEFKLSSVLGRANMAKLTLRRPEDTSNDKDEKTKMDNILDMTKVAKNIISIDDFIKCIELVLSGETNYLIIFSPNKLYSEIVKISNTYEDGFISMTKPDVFTSRFIIEIHNKPKRNSILVEDVRKSIIETIPNTLNIILEKLDNINSNTKKESLVDEKDKIIIEYAKDICCRHNIDSRNISISEAIEIIEKYRNPINLTGFMVKDMDSIINNLKLISRQLSIGKCQLSSMNINISSLLKGINFIDDFITENTKENK